MTTIPIVYASTSGNVEFVCQAVAKELQANSMQTSLHRAERAQIDIINDNQLIILATSTWEHGEINPFFDKLLKEMQTQNFFGKYAGVIGLGDTRYEPVLFCQGANILADVWQKKGGVQIGETLKINGDPYKQLEKAQQWAQDFIKKCKEQDLV